MEAQIQGACHSSDGSKPRQLCGQFTPVAMVKGPWARQAGIVVCWGLGCSKSRGDNTVESRTMYGKRDAKGLFRCPWASQLAEQQSHWIFGRFVLPAYSHRTVHCENDLPPRRVDFVDGVLCRVPHCIDDSIPRRDKE